MGPTKSLTFSRGPEVYIYIQLVFFETGGCDFWHQLSETGVEKRSPSNSIDKYDII